MTIILTQAVRIAGTTQPIGTQLTLEGGAEGDLVHRGCATYVTDPHSGEGDTTVRATTNPLTGGITSLTSGSSVIPMNKHANGFVLIGDSITAACDQALTLTSLVRSGGVVTVTANSHALLSGFKVRVNSVMPDSFNGYYEVTRTGANTFTYPCPGVDESATLSGHPSGGASQILAENKGNNGNWWGMLNGKASGGLRLIRNIGQGGWPASYMASVLESKYSTELSGLGPVSDFVILAGINDIIALSTEASIKTSLRSLYDYAISYGARVWACTIMPLGSGHASFNAANNTKICNINRWIKTTAKADSRIRVIDLYAALVNGTNGALIANASADNIHPSGYGARVMANTMWSAMSGVVVPADLRPVSAVDCYGSDASSANINDYGPWVSTTGGGTAGTVTGSVAANLTVDETGTGSVAAAVNAAALGYTQDVTLTAAADGDLVEVIDTATIPLARVANGDTLIGVVDVTITGVTAGAIKGVYANLLQVVGGVTGSAYSKANDSTAALFGTAEDTLTMTLVTPPVKFDSSATSLKLAVRLTASGVGTPPTMKIGRRGVIKNPWA